MRLSMLRFYVRVTLGLVALFCVLGGSTKIVGQMLHNDVITYITLDRSRDTHTIYMIDLTRDFTVEFISFPRGNSGFAFSPDGHWFSYFSFQDRTTRLHILNLDDGEMSLIELGNRRGAHIFWSSDSQQIAYLLDSDSRLRVIDRNGANDRIIREASAGSISWSPTGNTLLFIDNVSHSSEIVVLDAADAEEHIVYRNDEAYQNAAQWSPDGRFIAFLSNPHGMYRVSINVLENESSNVQTIWSDENAYLFQLLWSPDGNFIAYTDWSDGETGVYILPRTGGNSTNVLPNIFRPQIMAWSPESRRVLFTSQEMNSGEARLYIASINGAESFCITCEAYFGNVLQATWLP